MANPKCFSNYMGVWACKPDYLRSAVRAVQEGTWVPKEAASGRNADADLFSIVGQGVAVIPIAGPMMKGGGKFDEVSTVEVRRAIRSALASKDVNGILMHIDSPGGHVAGTKELADDVRSANGVKPVHAFIEDLGASAAFWVASQADRISANEMAEVGSIGVFMVLDDASKMFEEKGVTTHVISTGTFKGAGVPGAEVTEEQLAHFQSLVDGIGEKFFEAVKTGRGMGAKRLESATDGRTHLAADAKGMGLIDSVGSVDAAVKGVERAARERGRPRQRSAGALTRLEEAL